MDNSNNLTLSTSLDMYYIIIIIIPFLFLPYFYFNFLIIIQRNVYKRICVRYDEAFPFSVKYSVSEYC